MKRTNVKKTNRGITIIALVVTIIIMLILATVTIRIAFNGGLIGYAKKAAGDMQNAIDREQEIMNGRIEENGVWCIIQLMIILQENLPMIKEMKQEGKPK